MNSVIIILFSVFQLFLCSSVVVDSKSMSTASFEQHVTLFPGVDGTYYLNLSLGTPPQTFPFAMDTASSLVWVPCTTYFPQHFSPENSTSSKQLTCNSTQCNWLFPGSRCPFGKLCYYEITYLSKQTFGYLELDLLAFPDNETRLDEFTFGCSNYGYNTSSGILGFGRGIESLPSQMDLDGFSYCMVSHDYDNNTSTDLVLITKGGGGSNGEIVHYTPFIDNPESNPHAYYVRLHSITVGDAIILVPPEFQVPDNKGEGGTIVGSMTPHIGLRVMLFNLVANEFETQIIRNNSRNSRNATAENKENLGLCFNVWSFDDIPTLSLLFQGGAVMDLPMQNYILGVEYNVVCLMMTNGTGISGPAIVLGTYAQQNFYVEFDLINSRLGILKRTCNIK